MPPSEGGARVDSGSARPPWRGSPLRSGLAPGRFLAALNLDKPKSLSGIVEADETFILEFLQGSAGRPRQTRAPPRRQSRQARPLGRANSCRRGSRPQRRHVRRRPAPPRRRQPKRSVRRTNSAFNRFLLRRRFGHHRFRQAGQAQGPCPTRARQPQARRIAVPYKQRQRVPRTPQRVDATLPRRRHRKPSHVPELAPNPRSHAR